MKTLGITSVESLDSVVAEIVKLKIFHTRAQADRDAEVAAIQKRHQKKLSDYEDEIAELECQVQEYCTAHRAELFPEKKSREITLATYGFRFTPPRVEPASRKIKWQDVVERLRRLAWGKAYVRQPEPKPDKDALLSDREKLTPEQLTAAGIQFVQDEEFRIDPKPETAEATVKQAA